MCEEREREREDGNWNVVGMKDCWEEEEEEKEEELLSFAKGGG
jgi:hypothetical protein